MINFAKGLTVRSLTIRYSARICLLALFASLTIALAATPSRIAAQEAPPAAHARNPMDNPAVEETPSAEERQERAFLHPPIVKSVARSLNINEDIVSWALVAINFAIIFFGIGIPLARIVPKMMRKRTTDLQSDIKTAREATEDAKKRLTAVEAQLAGLGKEIEAFKAQVEQEAAADEKRIKASIVEDSQRIVASAEQEITAAAAQARRSLRNFAADLAIDQATSKLVLTPETDHALIAEFVSQANAERGGRN